MKSTILSVFLFAISFCVYSQTPGSLDLSFDPDTGTNTVIESIAIQTDGKILIGGPFNSYDGTLINGIARLNPDGTIDNTFNPGAGVMGQVIGQQYHVYDIDIQTDGKIILVGAFNNFDNTSRNRIVRLNNDGSLDTSFNPGSGADGTIRTVDIQPDGKILIGGSFTYYNGFPNAAPYIARINSNGTQDNSFNPSSGANTTINDLAIQADGKIVIVGDFTTYDGVARNKIARVNADGTLDTSLNPGTGTGGAFPSVRAIKIQNDGKLILSGYFDSYDGVTRGKIARINANGTLDTSFNPGTGADLNSIHKIEIMPSNDIILVGGFYQFNGTSRNSIARIQANGSLDTTFDPGVGCNNTGEALAIQADGKILVGGNFTQYDGTSRNYIARVHNGGGATNINEFEYNSEYNVYPNPTNGIITVTNSTSKVNYRIISINGSLVKDWTSSPTTNISSNNAGIYLLQTTTGAIIKFIKE